MSLFANDRLLKLLKGVSRSFYLSIAVLPRPVRRPIAVAYLLARAADTIADAGSLPAESRMELLHQLRDEISQSGSKAGTRREIPAANPAEAELLVRIEEVFTSLRSFDPEEQHLVREVLEIITSGQLLDLTRFKDAKAERIVALETEAELDDYTFRVAGCVGLFWTKLCRRHLFPNAALDDEALLGEAVEFGKGLQLVNILRDVPSDLRMGRCYLPALSLKPLHLEPRDLLAKENEPRLRPLYARLLGLAEAKLDSAWRYTNRLPYPQFRLRLACAAPILIGQETLRKLSHVNILDATQRVKVSRTEVRGLLLRAVLASPFPPLWGRLDKL